MEILTAQIAQWLEHCGTVRDVLGSSPARIMFIHANQLDQYRIVE